MKKSFFLILLFFFAGLIIVCMPRKSTNTYSIRQKIKFNPYRQQYIFFELKSMLFNTPIAGWSLDTLLHRSVLYIPDDMVHDGLPWFGALRDDWRHDRETRYHQGIDIYGDSLKIVAVQAGIIEKVNRDGFSGGVVKIDHGNYIKTVYIHLSDILVTEGMRITRGNLIGTILRPEGNAVQSQLHFELQVDGIKRDPIYYVDKTYRYAPAIRDALKIYRERKQITTRQRRSKVQAVN